MPVTMRVDRVIISLPVAFIAGGCNTTIAFTSEKNAPYVAHMVEDRKACSVNVTRAAAGEALWLCLLTMLKLGRGNGGNSEVRCFATEISRCRGGFSRGTGRSTAAYRNDHPYLHARQGEPLFATNGK